jgi:hypothetical protein
MDGALVHCGQLSFGADSLSVVLDLNVPKNI